MCFSSTPEAPPIPAPPPDPPSDADPGVKEARKTAKRKATSAQGYTSTILTSPMGDTSMASTTGQKQLTGL